MLLTDDPFVADEMSLPTITWDPIGPEGSRELDIESDLAKRITPDLGFTIDERWERLKVPGVGTTTGTVQPGIIRSGQYFRIPAFSSITVTDQAGQCVDLGNVQIPAGQPSRLQVGLKPLPPGTYTAKWHVASVDTHPVQGIFTVDVGGR